jgi:hypothetical protein
LEGPGFLLNIKIIIIFLVIIIIDGKPSFSTRKGTPAQGGVGISCNSCSSREKINGAVNLNKVDLFRKARLDLWKIKDPKEQEKQFKVNVIEIAFKEYPGISITTVAKILNITKQTVSFLIKNNVKQITGLKK